MTPMAQLSRRSWLLCAAAIPLVQAGCKWTSPVAGDPLPVEDAVAMESTGAVLTVGDLTGAWGMRPFKVEAIALVTGLNNTGSDPAQSPQRDILLGEMRTRDVANPNAVLASPRTAMVLVRGFLPPGVRKGDRIDLELRVPPHSETASLDGGWLMPTRLTEMAILDGRLRTGHDRAMAQGHVLTDAAIEGSSDSAALRRGRILGGGVALQSRPLGLALRSDRKSVRNSSLIAAAVNRRFSIFDQANVKQGVATPLRDNFIELQAYPCYRHNLWRFVRVVGEIPVRETPQQHVERMESLRRQLLEPTSASRAALKLEAVGKESIPILQQGLTSDNQEVQFYAAEALAYLDGPDAAPVLARLTKDVPAFRWHALTALSAMDDMAAMDELVELLHVDSAETRYGAFRAMLTRNAHDAAIKGEALGDHLALHVVNSDGPPLVHISRSRRAEVVIFGRNVRLQPLVLATDNHITVKSVGEGHFRVSCFAPGKDDRQIECSDRLDDIVRQLVAVGGTYPDVAHIIQQAKAKGALAARVEVDALPRPGRTYVREPAADGDGEIQVASPLPGLFASFGQGPSEREDAKSEGEPPSPEEEPVSNVETDKPWWNIFDRE